VMKKNRSSIVEATATTKIVVLRSNFFGRQFGLSLPFVSYSVFFQIKCDDDDDEYSSKEDWTSTGDRCYWIRACSYGDCSQ